jgi:hypothetical protein
VPLIALEGLARLVRVEVLLVAVLVRDVKQRA